MRKKKHKSEKIKLMKVLKHSLIFKRKDQENEMQKINE